MHKQNNTRSGFTIVELLIVIVVIAILATISVVAYTGIQQRARASALQNDLSQAKTKLMLFNVDNGRYPSSTTDLSSAGIAVTKSAYDGDGNNFYYCLNTDTGQFAIGARTVGNADSVYISSTAGTTQTNLWASASSTCRELGLTSYTDSNAISISGYANTGGWQWWVR